MMNTKIELIKEIYQIEDNDLEKRKEALEKIKPYINEIMDKFYEKLLSKDVFAAFIPVDRIPELKEKQIKFVAALLSEPFDEKLYNKIAKVAVVHYHIKLDPIYMSYGYHLLSELIIELSKKDTSILPYMKLVIKYFKVTDAIMSEEYFAQKRLSESPYRANNLFIAVNELHMAYMRYKSEVKNYTIGLKEKEEFEKRLDNLKEYKDILLEAGLNLSVIKRFATEFFNNKDKKSFEVLKDAIQKPLDNLSVSSYLSLDSSLATIRAMTDIIHQRKVTNEKNLIFEKVKQNISDMLGQNFGWAIEEISFLESEPDDGYEIIKHLMFKDKIFFLCLNIKDVANKLYITESIDLLTEAIKITLYIISRQE